MARSLALLQETWERFEQEEGQGLSWLTRRLRMDSRRLRSKVGNSRRLLHSPFLKWKFLFLREKCHLESVFKNIIIPDALENVFFWTCLLGRQMVTGDRDLETEKCRSSPQLFSVWASDRFPNLSQGLASSHWKWEWHLNAQWYRHGLVALRHLYIGTSVRVKGGPMNNATGTGIDGDCPGLGTQDVDLPCSPKDCWVFGMN